MKMSFDFAIHWLYAIIWSLLAISGFSMVSAKHGWLLDFNYATADYVHRTAAVAFVIVMLISIIHEIYREIINNNKQLGWFIIGRTGYQLFTFIMSLILIITGVIIWICMEFNIKAVAFSMLIHEYASYVALASLIWHIYKKAHILIWPKDKNSKNKVKE